MRGGDSITDYPNWVAIEKAEEVRDEVCEQQLDELIRETKIDLNEDPKQRSRADLVLFVPNDAYEAMKSGRFYPPTPVQLAQSAFRGADIIPRH